MCQKDHTKKLLFAVFFGGGLLDHSVVMILISFLSRPVIVIETRPSNTTLNNTKRQFYNTVVYCHNSVATLNDSGDFFNLKQLRILPK